MKEEGPILFGADFNNPKSITRILNDLMCNCIDEKDVVAVENTEKEHEKIVKAINASFSKKYNGEEEKPIIEQGFHYRLYDMLISWGIKLIPIVSPEGKIGAKEKPRFYIVDSKNFEKAKKAIKPAIAANLDPGNFL